MAYKGWENFDPMVRAICQKPAKRSKYGAQPTEVDGVRFASKKEATRYSELKLMEQGGAITALELQPKFPIFAIGPLPCEAGVWTVPTDWTMTKVGRYTADFAYIDVCTGKRVIEDTKSSATSTEAYRLRKKHVEAQYGITVIEV